MMNKRIRRCEGCEHLHWDSIENELVCLELEEPIVDIENCPEGLDWRNFNGKRVCEFIK